MYKFLGKAENACSVCVFGGGGDLKAQLPKVLRSSAFTMAEILLSLTIIGVVAAITLPSLTGNINERTWNTQRKALFARFSQAVSLMPALNGYGSFSEGNGSAASDTAAETFITAGLSKVLKINNVCDNEHLGDCGIPSQLTVQATGSIDSWPKMMSSLVDLSGCGSGSIKDTKAAAFETANGEAIALYYNPTCLSDFEGNSNPDGGWVQTQTFVCAHLVYDLNGSKGPNAVGKDIGGMTVINSIDPIVVAPSFATTDLPSNGSYTNVGAACSAFDTDYRAPNIYEMISLYFSRNLAGYAQYDYYYGTGDKWGFAFNSGSAMKNYGGGSVRCIKR